MASGLCSGCNTEKELTAHGDCFKCHISGLGTGTGRCKTCGNVERVKQTITAKVSMKPIN